MIRGLLALLGTLMALGLGSPSASAHSQPIRFTPDGQVAAGPAQASVTFNESLREESPFLQVVGPDGNVWSRGTATVDGDTVRTGLGDLGPAGVYRIAYRVTSADGHIVQGTREFTLTTAGPGTPGPPAQAGSKDSSIPLWPFIVGAAVVVAAGLVFALRKPR